MKYKTIGIATAAAAVLASTSLANLDEATLRLRTDPSRAGMNAVAILQGPADAPFALFAEVEGVPGRRFCLTIDRLDASGHATHGFEIPLSLAQSGAHLNVTGVYTGSDGLRRTTEEGDLDCFILLHEQLGFDYMVEAVELRAGEILAEQWAPVGLHVRAINQGGGPDLAVVFDSNAPTGGDTDLVTPGPGSGNAMAYDNLMIVAENGIDVDGDGLVDEPDDEAGGGILVFEWDRSVILHSTTLVDVDEIDPQGATLRSYYQGLEVENLFVPGLDDNNVRTIYFESGERVDRLEVDFSGSGAIAEVDFMPCPVYLTFDTTTTGMPFGYSAGEIVHEQWVSEGVTISGVTNNPDHPDAVVIFDTANPTGGDTDLVTPGYGPGNDLPRGQTLVLADNLIDLDGDGRVDDPGDSSGGGTFVIDFLVCSTLHTASVLDIDSTEPHCFFEAFDIDGLSLGVFPLAQAGDNSLQTVDFGDLERVRKLELTICASGSLVELVYCPTPGADEG